MTLQFRDAERDQIAWRDDTMDGEVVRSPLEIDALPSAVYRNIENGW